MTNIHITVDATEAKTKFGQYLDEASHQPVIIRKSKRNVAALISMREYERLQTLEDQLWKLKADMSAKEGFIGADESLAALQGILSHED